MRCGQPRSDARHMAFTCEDSFRSPTRSPIDRTSLGRKVNTSGGRYDTEVLILVLGLLVSIIQYCYKLI